LIVRDMGEADMLCAFIEGRGDDVEMERLFRHKVSDGFDFRHDLARIGVANQTTMLANESLAIARRIGESLARRYGAEVLAEHFRTFDTICSATQERQDAILELIEEPLDAMVVIGGYNSSNTNHLAKICSARVRTYHIADAACIDPATGAISHKPVDHDDEAVSTTWLDAVQRIGITAGASTPNNKIGEAIERILQARGLTVSA
jgi:4-hydroxy-3-methylbut-2-enyl diphosphate reductase